MDLVFRGGSVLHLPRGGSVTLGRCLPAAWDSVLISRKHALLQLDSRGTALDVSVSGRNALVVERREAGAAWDVVAVVDPGQSTVLLLERLRAGAAARFFVMSAALETAVELRPSDGGASGDKEAERQKEEEVVVMEEQQQQQQQPQSGSPAAKRTRLAAGHDVAHGRRPASGGGDTAAAAGGLQETQPIAAGAAAGSAAAGAATLGPARVPGGSPAAAASRTAAAAAASPSSSRPAAGTGAAADVASADGPMRLMRVRGIAPRHNAGLLGAKLRDLVKCEAGALTLALVSNYMVDMGWLLSCCPDLVRATQLVVVHGESAEAEDGLRAEAAQAGAAHVQLHRPPLPIQYGTHHSKAFLLTYPTGLRLIIYTANAISADCNDKTQGVWVQDFPRKAAAGPPSEFERSLAAYVRALQLPAGLNTAVQDAIAAHDFTYARGALVASTPGYHHGPAMWQNGHMRLRRLLSAVQLPAGFRGSSAGGGGGGGGVGGTADGATGLAGAAGASGGAAATGGGADAAEGLVVQCSSMGSVDEDWVRSELGGSLANHAGLQGQPQQLSMRGLARPSGPSGTGPLPLAIVWPTVEEVRNSLEGWFAGRSIPGPSKNVLRPFLAPYYAVWGGELVGRQRAMPHIKTYARYRGQQLAWMLVTSHNLSKAAWGALQKNGSQLMVRSYELGVLLTPAHEAAYRASPHYGYSCAGGRTAGTAAGPAAAAAAAAAQQPGAPGAAQAAPHEALRFMTFPGAAALAAAAAADTQGAPSPTCVPLPVPYALPPRPYGAGDVPWVVDEPRMQVDALGLPWGARKSHYGHREPDDQ